MFVLGTFPQGELPRAVRGRLNGQSFESLEDADPRVGSRLEVFMAGQYHWLPFEHLSSVRIAAPRRLRDLFWTTAEVSAGASLPGGDIGEVLLPVLTPQAYLHSDELVKLGRTTEWEELEAGVEVPVGQKMLLVDGESFPILEVRELEIDGPSR
jgi:type VI secretion system protein ImpE